MLRTAARSSFRLSRTTQHAQRSFVSTVLLSKTYEDKTVAELRTELRARGLSVSGTKASLITRIQHADARSASEIQTAPSNSNSASSRGPAPSQTWSRSVSSASAPREHAALNAAPKASVSSVKFDIKIPDTSQEEPDPSVQIPFVPDFWDSSAKKAEEAAASTLSPESSTPKIMLAASAETYPAGGPTYAMSPASDTIPTTEPPSSSPVKKYDGLLGDILDDLNIPPGILSTTPPSVKETSNELTAKRTLNRPLDEEERRGAITLLGLFLGAWVVAGLAAPSTTKNKKHH